jgi:LmbE family N-acetylglucosaminyl deacetylase
VETRLLPWMRLLRRVSEAEAAAEVLGAEEAMVVAAAATELERAATHAMARWLGQVRWRPGSDRGDLVEEWRWSVKAQAIGW